MIPFRIGDNVQVAEAWFAGATGTVRHILPESGVLMVELEEFGTKVPRGLVLPFAASELAPTRCQHPAITEAEYRAYMDRQWIADPPRCSTCYEWLYPEEEEDGLRVYVGEPRGAGHNVGAW